MSCLPRRIACLPPVPVFDPHQPESCVEERADPPKDKQRANFCEYFQPQAGAFQPSDDSTANRAKAELDKLFGK